MTLLNRLNFDEDIDVELDQLAPEITQTLPIATKRLARRRLERLALVRVTRRFGAAPERVFDAWLDSPIAGKWLFATATRPMTRVTIDARVGGSFCFVERQNGEEVTHTGKYIEIGRPRRLVFSLYLETIPRVATRVVVELVTRSRGCDLILIHEEVPQADAVRIRNRWTGILYGLGETLGKFSTRGKRAMRVCIPQPDAQLERSEIAEQVLAAGASS